MVLLTICLLVFLPVVLSYDCYDNKCQGYGFYVDRLIYCDQRYHYCTYSSSGYPLCTGGWSGNGVYCNADFNGTYYCGHTSYGSAYCETQFDKYMAYMISGIVLGVILVACCCFCLVCRGRRNRGHNGIIIQTDTATNYGAAGYAPPTDYPAHHTGYPVQPGGYPVQPSGYPVQPSGYPVQPGGYPIQPGVYSAQPDATANKPPPAYKE